MWRLCLTLTFASVLAEGAETVQRFARQEGLKIKDYFVYSYSITSSCMQCIALCQQDPVWCGGVSWGLEDHVCNMTDYAIMNYQDGRFEASVMHCTYARIPGIWKVWTADGPSTYTLTFEEAGNRCSSNHGRLATEEELLAERSIGYGMCFCGWLSSGMIGFVMQSDTGCWSFFTTGIHFCHQLLAGAYCIDDL